MEYVQTKQKLIHEHFRKNDSLLYSFILKVGALEPITKEIPANYFFRLCKEIVCQQLSDKSGEAIFNRFYGLFPTGFIQPQDILSIPHQKLRDSGMSHAKAQYVRNLAEAVVQKRLAIHLLDSMTDEEIIMELTKVKGIGPWTAEMFLMFALGRENVFSYGDLGLKKGLIKVYGFKKEPSKKQVEKIISKWSPYKSYASRILWRSLELI